MFEENRLHGFTGIGGGGRLGGGAGPDPGGLSSGPGGGGAVRVVESGLAGAAGMAETVDSTADSGQQAESSEDSFGGSSVMMGSASADWGAGIPAGSDWMAMSGSRNPCSWSFANKQCTYPYGSFLRQSRITS